MMRLASVIPKAVIPKAILLTALILWGANDASWDPMSALAQTSWPPPSGERLRALADKSGFLIGYASHGYTRLGQLPDNNFWAFPDAEIYQQVARSEFNIVASGNQMKWQPIHPQPQTYDFGAADRHVQFAVENGMKIVGHALLWHRQLPAWLTGRTWTRDELLAVLNDHIDKVAGHYAGKIAVWDVVNEAFEQDGTYRKTIWYNTIGPEYIALAFTRARQTDPNAKLVYNDYNTEPINPKSDAIYSLLRNLKQNNIPIDGVGFQGHLLLSGVDMRSFAANMARFAALGLEIYITELDVRIQGTPTAQSLEQQARIYRDVLRRCLAQPACKGLKAWGFTDKYSWIPESFPGYGAALLFDENYRPKPAYFAIQDELKKGR